MNTITKASQSLFGRPDDEVFSGWGDILTHLREEQKRTIEVPLDHLSATSRDGSLLASFSKDGNSYLTEMTDWSFGCVAKFTGVRGAYGTLNSLTPQTSATAINELLGRNSASRRDRVSLVYLSSLGMNPQENLQGRGVGYHQLGRKPLVCIVEIVPPLAS